MFGRERRGVGSLVSAALLVGALGELPACGDSGPSLEPAASCGAGWQTVVTLGNLEITSPLVYGDGVLYYGTAHGGPALNALPTAGGASTVLAQIVTTDLWLDGDRLLVPGGPSNNQLFAVPITGGEPQLVVDGSAPSDVHSASLHAVSATDYYWLQQTVLDGSFSVFRASLSGGAPVEVGTVVFVPNNPFMAVSLFRLMALSADAAMAVNDSGELAVFPFDPVAAGSPRVREPPKPPAFGSADLVGLDAAGVYWSQPTAGSSASDNQSSVMLEPPDGTPLREVWRLPFAHVFTSGFWPTGSGGWIVLVQGLFDDQRGHAAIWEVSADGTARVLGCSPDGMSAFTDPSTRPAIAPDAVYMTLVGDPTQIVRVPR